MRDWVQKVVPERPILHPTSRTRGLAASGVGVHQVLAHLAAEEQPQHDDRYTTMTRPHTTRAIGAAAPKNVMRRDAEQPLGEQDRGEGPPAAGQDPARHQNSPALHSPSTTTTNQTAPHSASSLRAAATPRPPR